MSKIRLDMLMVERGLAESRSLAQRLVMAGRVRIDGQTAYKPGMSVAAQAELTVEAGSKFVSRGGEKLEAALQSFKPDIQGRICADAGASTGGFTDCLLQHGAAKVYAIDVGRGILAWSLRQDSRVVVMERQNARYVDSLPEPVSVITVDVSFISLKLLLPVFKGWFGALTPHPPLQKLVLNGSEGTVEGLGVRGVVRVTALTPRPPLPKTGEGVKENGDAAFAVTSPLPEPVLNGSEGTGEGVDEEKDFVYKSDSPLPGLGEGLGVRAEVRGEVIALIKPQFEAGRAEVRRGEGVIRDPQVHRQVLLDVLGFAQQEGYGVRGLIRSPLLGPKGNVEFLTRLVYPGVEPGNIGEYVDNLILDSTE